MTIRSKQPKIPKVKKTLDELLGEGQLKTGKTLLVERLRKEEDAQIFAQAAQEEARMQRGRRR